MHESYEEKEQKHVTPEIRHSLHQRNRLLPLFWIWMSLEKEIHSKKNPIVMALNLYICMLVTGL